MHHFFLNNKTNISAVEKAINENKLVIVAVSKDGQESQERADGQFYDVGVIGNIMRKVSLPDGKIKVLFQGLAKGRISQFKLDNPEVCQVELMETKPYSLESVTSILNILRENVGKLSKINTKFPVDLIKTIDENNDAVRIADLISSVLKVTKSQAYKLFSQTDIEARLVAIIEIIQKEIENFKIQKDITQKVNSKIEKTHKDYFLKEQIKAIQQELGTGNKKDEEVKSYSKRLKNLNLLWGKMLLKRQKTN